MRLKTYTAPTIAEAMDMIRRELGEDAIIVSTQKGAAGSGCRVTAALEAPVDEPMFDEVGDELREPADVADTIRQALTYHGTPMPLAERLVRASLALDATDPVMACAGALDATFRFAPLPGQSPRRPIMLVGPPGAGKTVTVAKLAARAALARRGIEVLTTDTRRAGGVEQLAAFTRILQVELKTAGTPAELAAAVGASAADRTLFIDTAGTNPFSDTEIDFLDELVRASGALPVLVMAAGGDALEAADIADSFAAVGAERLLVTRLDMARRLGSILSAADAARLPFCDVSITPHIADGLSAINPVSLARLIMPEMEDSESLPFVTEATR